LVKAETDAKGEVTKYVALSTAEAKVLQVGPAPSYSLYQ